MRKYGAFRIAYKILNTFFGAGKALIVVWVPFIRKNPRMVRFIPAWLFSLRLGAAAYKDELPWLPFEAIEWLKSFLAKDMMVFEWGSGGSTLFIAKRVKSLISVEDQPRWYQLISQLLQKNNITNCRYILQNLDLEKYCKVIESYPDNFFDLVFVDGSARPDCIHQALKKVRPAGFLLLDDSNQAEHSPGVELLKGWGERQDFFGPKFHRQGFYQTTIWQKKP